jgi:PHP family Zn ribbon phosphoesterase
MKYDLHIHSCLSPCADDDMTPANIAGFAKLNGLDVIAVADHNAADNLPAVQAACNAYGLKLLPAIEVNTEEEIHLLAYLPSVQAALKMSDILYGRLPEVPYDREIWGRQLIMDENDVVLGEKQKLLSAAVAMDIYEVKALCERSGGVVVPAHVDKDSTSLLSVLGFAPEDLPFAAFEVRRPEHQLEQLLQTGRLPANHEILTSSDAHNLADIAEYPRELDENSALWPLIEKIG